MGKRETTKTVEVGGRKFRLGKFDALTGSYIAYKLTTELLPLGLSQKLGFDAPTERRAMSRGDFRELQMDCLRLCGEILPAGVTPVINDDGTFAVEGLENDTGSVLVLTIQALAHNVQDFFDGDLLDSLSKGLPAFSPPAS
jgi:hypothetical protein